MPESWAGVAFVGNPERPYVSPGIARDGPSKGWQGRAGTLWGEKGEGQTP